MATSAAGHVGVLLMLGRVARLFSLLLFGWFVFMLGAAAYAKAKGRESVTPEPDADEIDLVTTFGPMEYHSTAAAFRGGTVTTWFGGGTIDLRNATLDPAGATIKTSTLFGGGNLIVPDDWRVETGGRGRRRRGRRAARGQPAGRCADAASRGRQPVRRLGGDLRAARRRAPDDRLRPTSRGQAVADTARGSDSPATITLPWPRSLPRYIAWSAATISSAPVSPSRG